MLSMVSNMRMEEINPDSLDKISDKELLNIHRRTHQLYGSAKKRSNNQTKKFIYKKHDSIIKEMKKRSMRHTTDLVDDKTDDID